MCPPEAVEDTTTPSPGPGSTSQFPPTFTPGSASGRETQPASSASTISVGATIGIAIGGVVLGVLIVLLVLLLLRKRWRWVGAASPPPEEVLQHPGPHVTTNPSIAPFGFPAHTASTFYSTTYGAGPAPAPSSHHSQPSFNASSSSGVIIEPRRYTDREYGRYLGPAVDASRRGGGPGSSVSGRDSLPAYSPEPEESVGSGSGGQSVVTSRGSRKR